MSKLLEVQDELGIIRSLNEAVFMATEGLSDPCESNALSALIDVIDKQLEAVIERVNVLRISVVEVAPQAAGPNNHQLTEEKAS